MNVPPLLCPATTCGAGGGDDRGFAMVMVLVFIAASLLAVTAGYEKLRQVTIAEAGSDRVPTGDDGVAEALGSGIARLQTGVPPEDPFTCRIKLRSSDGSGTLHFDLQHVRLANDRWSIEARPADDSQPLCPPSFGDVCPLVLP